MANTSLGLDPQLYQYLIGHSVHETDLQRQLRAETAQHPMGQMQIAPEQGQFMAWLIRLMGARKALEVGVFTGYSALTVALALPPDGQLIACDVSEEFTAIARRYWQQAGVAAKIDLRLAPAAETLQHLIDTGEGESFDFAFIDADKSSYTTYYEQALQLIRPGGVIAIDNVLWSGRVAEPEQQDNRTIQIRAFNQHVFQDQRVHLSLVPIADGLTLVLKKS